MIWLELELEYYTQGGTQEEWKQQKEFMTASWDGGGRSKSKMHQNDPSSG